MEDLSKIRNKNFLTFLSSNLEVNYQLGSTREFRQRYFDNFCVSLKALSKLKTNKWGFFKPATFKL